MSKKNITQKHCCFCGRPEEEVPFLFQGIDSWICSDCVEAAHGMLEDSEREYRKSARPPFVGSFGIAIVAFFFKSESFETFFE